ncbi:MAG: HAD family hydrolase [Lachnospiraceae bacterium]|nr:HAD family hydrolase [Lachnospiraceae bacterium]
MMRKAINDYSLYVFDLDGTLYDQPRLRRIMAFRLALYYGLHPYLAGELFVLQHFRKTKDKWTENASEADIIKKVAEETNTREEKVLQTVRKWIYDAPLTALPKTRDDALASWIEKLRKAGKKVAVLSDYPTEDKLKALGISVDRQYGPDDARIDELKPSPKGLITVMADFGISAEDVLMIGDRMEKDGKCAEAAGADHIILERKVNRRKPYEDQI